MSTRSEPQGDEDTAYHAIFEASSDGLVVSDAETGIVLAANPAFCRMHGYDDMVGLHPTTFIHPNSHHLFEAYVHAIRNGLEFRTRAQDVRRDGTTFDVEVLGRGFVFEGRFALLGFVRDMTEQVLADQNLEDRVVERTREIDRRRQVAEALSELLSVVNSRRALDDMLSAIVAQAARLLGSDAESLYLVDESDPGLLRLQASRNIPSYAEPMTVATGTPVMGLAAERRRPVVAVDLPALVSGPFATSVDKQIADRGTYLEVVSRGPHATVQPARENGRVLSEHFCSLVAVPLMARQTAHGALMLAYRSRHVPTVDELELIAAFAGQAGLAIENARLHSQSEQQRRELEALYEADAALHKSLRLQDVLNALVDAARDLLRVDGVGLWGMDAERGDRIVPLASRGLSDEYLLATTRLNDEAGVLEFWQAHDALFIEDVESDPSLPSTQREQLVREGYRALLTMQIRVGAEPFGRFTVGRRTPHRFSEQEQRLLSALAQRAGLAIQNARLYEQAQQAATLEERQRLARELHDAVTQTLFSTALIADVLPQLWDLDAAEARARLMDLRRLTRGAMAEMRTLLVELRPDALTDLSLGELFRQLVEATAGRTRLEVSSRVEGPVRRLPPRVHIALYRLAQEALNNIVKHSQAVHASVELTFTDDGVQLRVTDDGCGFVSEGADIPPGHFGLGIMRERAAAIGAQLRIISEPGAGTVVEVTWNLNADV
ncbi:MAG TPA: GAF domain-containing protein [Chloroflexota bacterium]